jgi:ankyrin repeat protein
MNYFMPCPGLSNRLETPLIYAIKENKVEIAKYIIDNCLDIDIVDSKDRTALDHACECNNLELVKYLLDHGAKVSSFRRNALVTAVTSNIEILKLLLNHDRGGVDQKYKSDTPVFRAIYCRKYEHLKLLLEHGANPNAKNFLNDTPLQYMCFRYNGYDYDIVKCLLDHGADPNTTDVCGRPAISHYARYSNIKMFRLLLNYNAKLKRDQFDQTVLMYACERNNLEVVKILVEELKVDVNEEDSYGKTALMYINYHRDDYYPITKYLLEHSANLFHNKKDLSDQIAHRHHYKKLPSDLEELFKIYKDNKISSDHENEQIK